MRPAFIRFFTTAAEFKKILGERLAILGVSNQKERRELIVGSYYKAFTDIEEKVEKGEVEKNIFHVDDAIKIYRIQSDREVKGVSVIAKSGDKTIGRLFIAHPRSSSPDDGNSHISILDAENEEIVKKMMVTYFADKTVLNKDMRLSCIGFYSHLLRQFLPLQEGIILPKTFPARILSEAVMGPKTAVKVSDIEVIKEELKERTN